MSKVVVTGDVNGNVIGVSENNPDYGYVRVEQTGTFINDQGWLRMSKRSTLIKGLVRDLQEANFKAGQELPGKIVVVESLVPFNPENPDRDLKIAGDTGVICRIDDQPIYRQTFFTSNLDAIDELITHTNSEEIREVQAAQKAVSALKNYKRTEEVADL
jgi:hypothetical protein